MSVSRVGRGRRLLVVDEERADEAPAEVGEREALRLEVAVGVAEADDEVDERLIGVAAVDRERRDARADDDREREEALADDLAERLEAADALADALEPAVGAHGVEVRSLAAWPSRHVGAVSASGSHAEASSVVHGVCAQCTQTGLTPQPSQRRGVAPRRAALEHAHVAEREVVLRRVGRVEARERARDLLGRSSTRDRGARVKPRFRESLWMWTSTGHEEDATGRRRQRPRSTPSAGRTIQRRKRRRRLRAARRRAGPASRCAGPRRAPSLAQARRRRGWRRTTRRARRAARRVPRRARARSARRASRRSRCTRARADEQARDVLAAEDAVLPAVAGAARSARGSSAARAGRGPRRARRSSSLARIVFTLPNAIARGDERDELAIVGASA